MVKPELAATSWTEHWWDLYGPLLDASHAGNGPCHDLAHAVRVAILAERIAVAEDADPRLAALAGLVHDVGHGSAGPTDDHNVRSAAWLRDRLVNQVAHVDLEILVEAVLNRRFRHLAAPAPSTTAAVLDDADNLDALGAHGIARVFLWVGEHGRATAARKAVDAVSAEVRALGQHQVEKLGRLPGLMRTATGRLLAAQRIAYLRDFLDRLGSELLDAGTEQTEIASVRVPASAPGGSRPARAPAHGYDGRR